MSPSVAQLVCAAEAMIGESPLCARGQGRSLYEGKEVETYLAPLLGRARRVGSFGMLWYRLVHREGTLVATYLCYSVCAVLLMITGAWRPLGTWLLKGLHGG